MTRSEHQSRTEFGSACNVLLSESELAKLTEKFGEAKAADWIETFSLQKAAHGYKYKSDYHAILAWNRSEEKREAKKQIRGHIHTAGCRDFGFCPDHSTLK